MLPLKHAEIVPSPRRSVSFIKRLGQTCDLRTYHLDVDENATYHCFEINSKKQQENNKKRGAIYRPVSQSKSVIQTHRQCVAPAITIKQRSSRSDDGKREENSEGSQGALFGTFGSSGRMAFRWSTRRKVMLRRVGALHRPTRWFCIPYSINCNTYEREKTFRELQVRTNTKCFQARVNDVSPKEGDGRLKIVQKRIAREGERKRGRARERAAASSILFNPISRRKRLSTYICLRLRRMMTLLLLELKKTPASPSPPCLPHRSSLTK